MISKITTGIGASLLVLTMAMAFPILGTLFGAISGWAVGLFFDDTLAKFTAAAGLDVRPWEVGAALGFVSGYFTTVTKQRAA